MSRTVHMQQAWWTDQVRTKREVKDQRMNVSVDCILRKKSAARIFAVRISEKLPPELKSSAIQKAKGTLEA
ncbi:hypothetical protein PVK06_049135 [Gossypium arboreum]|uniref:Uncharacterized protein n=1 Tax=Gossypium arboreum TaxID=29729 RepID=A0ABR0MHS2_GOSAR|nr:hypothetical protein PVK06_049135 [Gossypium arboreum]